MPVNAIASVANENREILNRMLTRQKFMHAEYILEIIKYKLFRAI